MDPVRISPPTSAIPGPKELRSPINPIRVGVVPPPIRKAMGTVSDTIMFLSLGELTMDNAARPAGKKQTATNGCRKTATLIQDELAKPINIVINPVIKNTILKICFGPIRSVAQPPNNVVATAAILDSAISVLAQLRSMP